MPTQARGFLPISERPSTRSRRTRSLVDALGHQLVKTFVAMKRFEVERFTEAVGELDPEIITEWELEEYAFHL